MIDFLFDYIIRINSRNILLIPYFDFKYQITPVFLPTLENPAIAPNEEKFMTQCSLNHFQSGDYHHVPYLMGTTSEEALLYIKSMNNFFVSES